MTCRPYAYAALVDTAGPSSTFGCNCYNDLTGGFNGPCTFATHVFSHTPGDSLTGSPSGWVKRQAQRRLAARNRASGLCPVGLVACSISGDKLAYEVNCLFHRALPVLMAFAVCRHHE
jgi:hypothetical protein